MGRIVGALRGVSWEGELGDVCLSAVVTPDLGPLLPAAPFCSSFPTLQLNWHVLLDVDKVMVSVVVDCSTFHDVESMMGVCLILFGERQCSAGVICHKRFLEGKGGRGGGSWVFHPVPAGQ